MERLSGISRLMFALIVVSVIVAAMITEDCSAADDRCIDVSASCDSGSAVSSDGPSCYNIPFGSSSMNVDEGSLFLTLFIFGIIGFCVLFLMVYKLNDKEEDAYNRHCRMMKEGSPMAISDDVCIQSPDNNRRESAKCSLKAYTKIPYGSYVVSIDGRICGYIGTEPSVIEMPVGYHILTVSTNDVNGIVILEKKVLCNECRGIEVVRERGRLCAIVRLRNGESLK